MIFLVFFHFCVHASESNLLCFSDLIAFGSLIALHKPTPSKVEKEQILSRSLLQLLFRRILIRREKHISRQRWSRSRIWSHRTSHLALYTGTRTSKHIWKVLSLVINLMYCLRAGVHGYTQNVHKASKLCVRGKFKLREEKSFKMDILHGWNDFNTSCRSRFSVTLDKLS